MGYAVDNSVGYIVDGYTCGNRVRFYEDIPYAAPTHSRLRAWRPR
jgi:hypothetical protein